MKKIVFAALAALALTACGAHGTPQAGATTEAATDAPVDVETVPAD